MASVKLSSSALQLKWPQDLDEIKMSPEEVREISEQIKKIIDELQPKTSFTMPTAMSWRKDGFPRSVFVTYDSACVILNSHGGMRTMQGGAQQGKIKHVWDALNGRWCVKKSAFNSFEYDLSRMLMTSDMSLRHIEDEKIRHSARKALPNIIGIYTTPDKAKQRIIEERLSMDLNKYFVIRGKKKADVSHVLDLQNALMVLHSMKYKGGTFEIGNVSTSFSYFGPVYHGDISPRNILCFPSTVNPKCVSYRFTDFSGGCNENVIYTPGWGSPETLRYLKKRDYQHLSPIEFNQKFGQKKDVWSFALIVGTLLKYGFNLKYLGLPPFSFIINKLDFDSQGRLEHNYRICDITQKEVDDELDLLIELAAAADRRETLLTTLWQLVKHWLRVDPNERPNLKDCHLSS